jgi:hypothetical protein
MVEVKLEILTLWNVKPGGRQREAVHLPVQGAGGPPSGREDHAVPRYVQHVLFSVADPCHFVTDPDPRIHASGSGFRSGSAYFRH